ncbi:hypothetical protein E2562_035925 [Oryza meyeriana var. granulata]|uniref:Uncharacterized protein n=1 Tax=Oryza meyeriana var. granulata TaxID=110450 RepID=A0A6G1CWR8_9ORYZ|nr:hypothetical protein E2562_035925 [Oryza meyeriana var. granulata]
MEMEEKTMAGCQIPAFGVWNYCNDLPITQCFDLAIQARLTRRANRRRGGDSSSERRLVVPFDASPPATCKLDHIKVIRREVAEKQYWNDVEQMMQGRAVGAYATKRKLATKAVDEDLYKVPQPLVYQKPRKERKVVWSLWIGCLGLDCMA